MHSSLSTPEQSYFLFSLQLLKRRWSSGSGEGQTPNCHGSGGRGLLVKKGGWGHWTRWDLVSGRGKVYGRDGVKDGQCLGEVKGSFFAACQSAKSIFM